MTMCFQLLFNVVQRSTLTYNLHKYGHNMIKTNTCGFSDNQLFWSLQAATDLKKPQLLIGIVAFLPEILTLGQH